MIEIEKLSQQQKNFGLKLFFSYITFTLLLITSITIIHIYLSDDLKLKKFDKEASLQSGEKKKEFNNFFLKRGDSVLAISRNEYFLKFIEDGSYNYYIDLLFLTMMEANKDYMQMRFIDANGMEKLRFERDKKSKEPFKTFKFQDKSNRYYYKEVKKLKKDQIWFSPIDLNIEHGKIEIPYKSVVRVATPIFINNKFKGILILNIFMKELFDSITKSSIYNIYLTDENGFFIKHINPKHNWSFYDSKHKIDMELEKSIVKEIYSENFKGRALLSNIYLQPLRLQNQRFNLIFIETDKSIKEVKANNNKMIIAILIFSFFMSILFSIIFSRPLKHMYEIVESQAIKLHDLATNLDKKVQVETLKNAKKDRLIQNQSKLAELGDMIGNIAHQWRHPLTRLSLNLQNLKAYHNKGKLSDELLKESIETSLFQIDFMSKTIDNFKDFYKKDKKKQHFSIQESYNSIINIIGPILDHSNINISIKDDVRVSIFGNKNEFSQVIMNLIINAKDALVENNVNNPIIKITVNKKETSINVTIEDNAGGIPETIISDIFNPYFTTKKEKGTGIGLYLSKAIIEDKFKGKISVKNSQKGAVFNIELKA